MLAYFKGLSLLRKGSSREDDATQCIEPEKVPRFRGSVEGERNLPTGAHIFIYFLAFKYL